MKPFTPAQRDLAGRYLPLARSITRRRFSHHWRRMRTEAVSAAHRS